MDEMEKTWEIESSDMDNGLEPVVRILSMGAILQRR
eukprot:CAMPEP_0168316758 /NCGR_PEP_ID=MMETSP0210-20121227/18936_1 /TAXON_ID=40633 /ORGANISM="Condylostoma magnum, Strain COL2" /LENGTH=35 /DNA_ID= /DNA_START= /DNA_END= /DNA_ORIENTATION=